MIKRANKSNRFLIPLQCVRPVVRLTGRFIFSVITTMVCCHSAVASGATIETAGNIGQIMLPVTAMSVTIYYADMAGLKEFAYAGLTTITTVQILKHTVHRTRPNGHDQSFPSGHTAAAFLGAGFLQMRYGWAYGVPAYLAATFIGYSRVQSHNHWPSDVLAGAALGTATNLVFTSQYAANMTVVPYSNLKRKESGIIMTTQW